MKSLYLTILVFVFSLSIFAGEIERVSRSQKKIFFSSVSSLTKRGDKLVVRDDEDRKIAYIRVLKKKRDGFIAKVLKKRKRVKLKVGDYVVEKDDEEELGEEEESQENNKKKKKNKRGKFMSLKGNLAMITFGITEGLLDFKITRKLAIGPSFGTISTDDSGVSMAGNIYGVRASYSLSKDIYKSGHVLATYLGSISADLESSVIIGSTPTVAEGTVTGMYYGLNYNYQWVRNWFLITVGGGIANYDFEAETKTSGVELVVPVSGIGLSLDLMVGITF